MAAHTTTTDRPERAASLPCRRRLLTSALVGIGIALPARDRAGGLPVQDAAPPDPDERLIGACSAFEELERKIRERHADSVADDPLIQWETTRLLDQQAALVELIAGHQAVTIAGLCRKAHTIAVFADDLLDPSPLWDRHLTASLLRDLIGADVNMMFPAAAHAHQPELGSRFHHHVEGVRA